MTLPVRGSLADVEAWGFPCWGKNDVYIGREDPRRKLDMSKWANPFKIIPNQVDREEAIRQFRLHIVKKTSLLKDLQELSGKRLVCACAWNQPCHGDVLIDLFREKLMEEDNKVPAEPKAEDDLATSDEDEDGILRPKLGEGNLGKGAPLKTTVFGKRRDFHDGAGLCSPGRWSPELESQWKAEW